MKILRGLLLLLCTTLCAAICHAIGYQSDKPTPSSDSKREPPQAIALLEAVESQCAGLEPPMRAWLLWQAGMVYQTKNRAKALETFETALRAALEIPDERSGSKLRKLQNDMFVHMTGRGLLSPRMQLQANIARSIVALQPGKTEELLRRVDSGVRSDVLSALFSGFNAPDQIDQAIEMLQALDTEDEVPYEAVLRLTELASPEQAAEVTRLFSLALNSYRNHAPHMQMVDDFTTLVSQGWKRVPKELVSEAITEILKQAQRNDSDGRYAISSETGSSALHSLYEYRLFQLLPALQEVDPSAADESIRRFPAVASALTRNSRADSTKNSRSIGTERGNPKLPSFHIGGGNSGIIAGSTLKQAAERIAARADDHPSDAIAEAVEITDSELRAQIYEYIATSNIRKAPVSAAIALEKMLESANDLKPMHRFRYYSSAAEVYLKLSRTENAKKCIESGLAIADELYKSDSNGDDPNTALKAFWPSVNAYSSLLRSAARISDRYAMSLMQALKDPEIKLVAQIAVASGLVNAPTGALTMMITSGKRISFSTVERQ